jgi:hypothetical protein
MSTRKKIALLVALGTCLACLAEAYQVLLLWQGKGYVPLLDTVLDFLELPVQPIQVDDSRILILYYNLIGTGMWLILVQLTCLAGTGWAKMIEMGFDAYMDECKARTKRSERLAQLERARARRRERNAPRAAPVEIQTNSSFGAFTLGIALTKIL